MSFARPRTLHILLEASNVRQCIMKKHMLYDAESVEQQGCSIPRNQPYRIVTLSQKNQLLIRPLQDVTFALLPVRLRQVENSRHLHILGKAFDTTPPIDSKRENKLGFQLSNLSESMKSSLVGISQGQAVNYCELKINI